MAQATPTTNSPTENPAVQTNAASVISLLNASNALVTTPTSTIPSNTSFEMLVIKQYDEEIERMKEKIKDFQEKLETIQSPADKTRVKRSIEELKTKLIDTKKERDDFVKNDIKCRKEAVKGSERLECLKK